MIFFQLLVFWTSFTPVVFASLDFEEIDRSRILQAASNTLTLLLITALFFFVFAVTGLVAQSPIAIYVDAKHLGAPVSPDFSGLSFELSQLSPDDNDVRYFRPDNQPLITLFRTLGIKNLRVGGNTADRNAGKQPGRADIDSLFAFAKAADVRVIYCLRLYHGNPQEDADVAKYIMDRYPDQIACFSIGQEPNVYPRVTNWIRGVEHTLPRPSYADYAPKWKQFEAVISAAAPDAKFCGPSVDADPAWPRAFVSDFGHGFHVSMITAHFYPGRSGDRVPSPEIGRDEILSGSFLATYKKFCDGFVPAATADGLPCRLEEANNFFNGGAANVSDTFASALWGLDFMHWWAAQGLAGINFHTGDKLAAGANLRPSKYTAYFTTSNGFTIRPLAYSIKAFDMGAGGRIIPVTISNPQNLNLTAYAVLGDDGHIVLTIINKEHGVRAHDANISLGGVNFTDAQVVSLTVPSGNVDAKAGMTLGGAPIKNDGTWSGRWAKLTPAASVSFTLKVPAASATILKLAQ